MELGWKRESLFVSLLFVQCTATIKRVADVRTEYNKIDMNKRKVSEWESSVRVCITLPFLMNLNYTDDDVSIVDEKRERDL